MKRKKAAPRKPSKRISPPSDLTAATGGEAAPGAEDSCRCKEVAKKTPSELVKLMVKDLAVWKKGKK